MTAAAERLLQLARQVKDAPHTRPLGGQYADYAPAVTHHLEAGRNKSWIVGWLLQELQIKAAPKSPTWERYYNFVRRCHKRMLRSG